MSYLQQKSEVAARVLIKSENWRKALYNMNAIEPMIRTLDNIRSYYAELNTEHKKIYPTLSRTFSFLNTNPAKIRGVIFTDPEHNTYGNCLGTDTIQFSDRQLRLFGSDNVSKIELYPDFLYWSEQSNILLLPTTFTTASYPPLCHKKMWQDAVIALLKIILKMTDSKKLPFFSIGDYAYQLCVEVGLHHSSKFFSVKSLDDFEEADSKQLLMLMYKEFNNSLIHSPFSYGIKWN